MTDISKVVAPRMPNAPLAYEPAYQEQFMNILRLYFNQLDNANQQLITNSNLLYSVYTVATLPSAVTSGKGARTFVSDALAPVFGATVATGGAIATPVYSDGTNWKVG
jgi:hypothetical protein